MGRRRLKFKDLKAILRSFGVKWRRGKGDHVVFFKKFPDGVFTYPVPEKIDVLPGYVKGCRKKFRLLPEDGVSDDDFFGRA